MNINQISITIRDLYNGFDGEYCYGGKLRIRPDFQRNFCYSLTQQKAVIATIRQGFPLSVMYWYKNEDGTYDLLDGQQRILSICKFLHGDFAIYDGTVKVFDNLTADKKDAILDYKLQIYVCNGADSERLNWFKTVNIAGEEMEEQEIRNAIYGGTWVEDAKKHFSQADCDAWRIGQDYISGDYNRQKYLEVAIMWIVNSKKSVDIEKYMATHQNTLNATELWLYFVTVINWVKTLFPHYRKQMKGVPWGFLWNQYHKNIYNVNELEEQVSRLMQDEEVQKKSGIYPYLFDHDEKHLNLRAFPESIKTAAYEQQQGICKICGKHFAYDEMEADHITPWSQGGKTTLENCQMLCVECNRRKSDS